MIPDLVPDLRVICSEELAEANRICTQVPDGTKRFFRFILYVLCLFFGKFLPLVRVGRIEVCRLLGKIADNFNYHLKANLVSVDLGLDFGL